MKQAGKNPKLDQALLAKAKKLLEVNREVVTSRTEFTTDPQVMLDARRELAETMESMSKAVSGGN